MADPVSIVGLVTGLLSLGLQAQEKLRKYFGTVSGQREEIANLSRQADLLALTLSSLQRSTQTSITLHRISNAAVTPNLLHCREQLELLRNEISSWEETYAVPPPATALREKLKKTAKKFDYPRQRDSLSSLETKVQSAVASLELAIKSLQMWEPTPRDREACTADPGLPLASRDWSIEIHTTLAGVLPRITKESSKVLNSF